MTGSALTMAAVLAPFAAALLAPALGRALGAGAGRVLAFAFLPALLLALGADEARSGAPLVASLPWVPGMGLEIGLRADGFSLMFALVVGGIGFLILMYAASYLGHGERHGRFYTYLLLFGGAMLGLVLADNLIALFAFWEMTSIASFLLIGFWDSRRASQDGALKALLVTAIGGLALLAAVILLAVAGGTWSLAELQEVGIGELRSSPAFLPAAILLLVAAATKSAQLPFHLWLPTAMEAPTPVSAFLHSATMVKAGVLLVAKFGFLIEGTALADVALWVGLATMVWGSYLALRQNDLKALLAYSTVSQLGLLTALYGAGHAFAATAHLVNHAAFKATLFMVVGIVDHEARTRSISDLSGLARRLPVTAIFAVIGALSMAGILFGGFISKELFYEEMLHDGALQIAVAVLGSVMTFAYSLRFLRPFFGRYRSPHDGAHEAAPAFLAPVAPLALAVVLFGYVPLDRTVATWFTDLAAPTFGYEPEALYPWHGLSLALGLSVLTWFVGTALFVIHGPFARLQRRLTPEWNANTVYFAGLGGLEHFSAGFTRLTQGARFTTHLRLVVAALALAGGALAWRGWPGALSPVPPEVAAAGLLLVAGAVGTLRARSRMTALILIGLTGFGTALTFLLLRAPDLALTQLLIESITVILFLSVFRYLPRMTRYERPRPVAALDALLATGVAATVFAGLVAVQSPIAPRIRDYFLAWSKEAGGGYNVVNVILVDFRGYDTMGEITVLAVVAVSVYALLKVRAAPQRERPRAEGDEDVSDAFGDAASREGER